MEKKIEILANWLQDQWGDESEKEIIDNDWLTEQLTWLITSKENTKTILD